MGPTGSSTHVEDDFLNLTSSTAPFDPAVLVDVLSQLGIHGGDYGYDDGIETYRRDWSAVIDEAWWNRCTDPRALVAAVPYFAPDGSPLFKDRGRRFWLCACAAGRFCHERYKGRAGPVFDVLERFADGPADGAELTAARDTHLANDPADPWPFYSPDWPFPYPFEDNPGDPPTPFWQHSTPDSFARAIVCEAFDELRQVPVNTYPGGQHFSPDDPAEFERLSAAAAARLVRLVRDVFGNPFRPVRLDASWLQWHDGTVPKLARVIYDRRAFDRLPLLGDALSEAGRADDDILAHCRQPGEHVRGCFVVDLALGKC
jgi:hypothetical protein